ncbi:DUF11 domain-containing protein [Aureibaculum algae]|uniref:DUF11 domain-containing protein n=2 Tax=Aureibaculum algae TaxID=2584122 RepID=A0A5B7TKM2_9FLAO|nr:DUF11 domain-containing protein [Aureibaculum algae]
MPGGLTYVSDDGAYVSGTGVWIIGTLNSGATATLNIVTGVNFGTAGTTITNTITAVNADQTDSNVTADDLTESIVPSIDAPPVITAVGNEFLCPGPGNSQNIATSVSLTDPDDTTTDAVYIQISSGYVTGEDLLTLTGTHPNITSSFDVTEGELTLQGPTTFAEFEVAILAVEYSSNNASATGTRQFSITSGTANYLPPTDHYYEFVTQPNISWTAANAAANARTYFGLQGYLATLTSQVEADFSGSQATGVGWIGATDAASEGDWRWVTGPEGLANGGTGTPFWSGNIGGITVPPTNFAFWNSNEPNDYPGGAAVPGQENYAHITDVSVTSSPGSWNDLPNTTSTSGAYQAQGYVVEYGGTVGDPVLNISATTTITLTSISIDTQPSNQTICETENGSFSVIASGSNLTYQWQISTNGGSTFTDLSDGVVYSDTDAAILNITGALPGLHNNQYRVIVANGVNGCSPETSDAATLTVSNPAVTDPGDFNSCLTGETLVLQAEFVSATAEYTWYEDADTTPVMIANGVGLDNIIIATPGAYQLVIDPVLACTSDIIFINAIPCAVDDSSLVIKDNVAGVVIDVLANDADIENDIDVSSINNTSLLAPSNGTISINTSTGEITYVPNAGFSGTDTFEYQICDTNTPALCDVALVVVAVEVDTDSDGVADIIDLDDDNDGIPDTLEAAGNDPSADSDGDGILAYLDEDDSNVSIGDDTPGIEQIYDFDGDGIPNHFDLDSDNDAIPDVIEAGYTDANNDGLVDTVSYGTNGLADEVETSPDSGILAVIPINSDAAYDNNPSFILYNFLDVDSDNDGITDTTEAFSNNTTYNDVDNDGQIDGFLDVDSNGWHDTIDVETNLPTFLNSDSDSIPNYLDLDSDGDGLPDTFEGNFQVTDGDNNGIVGTGIPVDSDGDGLADTNDPDEAGNVIGGFGFYQDRDGDGVNNTLDIDIDNDGIIDNTEGQPTIGYQAPLGTDTDGDGIDDAYDVDNGGVGIGYTNTDGGSAPDYADTDADDPNGLGADPYDILENFYTGPGEDDFDNDGILDLAAFNDADNDGLADIFDLQPTRTAANNATNGGQTPFSQPDTNGTGDRDWRDLDNSDNDGDGLADTTDIDDDNDGILDTVEGTGDFDGDGVLNKDDLDSDNDGIPDYTETGGTADTDSSGMPGTGVLDVTEVDLNGLPSVLLGVGLTPVDTDGDGIPDYHDVDSDNDGITDVLEAAGVDDNGDGRYGTGTGNDSDADGIIDAIDLYDNRDGNLDTLLGGTPLAIPDTDSDGLNNYIDLDSDNDTVPDNVEGQSTVGYIALAGIDTDGDGLDNNYDTNNGGATIVPVNTDGTGDPDYLDLDADDDSLFDIVEAGNGSADTDTDGKTNGTIGVNGLDDAYDDGTGGDTFIDPNGALDDTQSDNFPDADLDVLLGGDVDYRDISFNDNDSDGVSDVADLDDDNDGILDIVESNGVDPLADADSDGVPNYRDADFCTLNAFLICGNLDVDVDGIPNHLDLDSDSDGIPDNIEAQTTLGYAPPDVLDSDGNGLDDRYENTPGSGEGLTPVNTDSADNPDYLDTDSDNDLLDDSLESGITLTGTDTDGDGLDDATDAASGYTDPGGTIDNPLTGGVILPDADTDVNTGGDVDFRDNTDDTADLSLLKSINTTTPVVGNTVVFSITVANNGPGNATGIEVTDQLPSGYTYVSDNGAGSYNSSTGVWAIANLNTATSTTLQITATVNGTGLNENTAEITASNNLDPDSFPNNNIVSEDDQSTATSVPFVDVDHDADGILNLADLDDDNDGITDAQELCGTDPVTGPAPSSTIEVTIDLDNDENETTWILTDASDNTIAGGGSYVDSDEIIVSNSSVLNSGNYTFTIFDSGTESGLDNPGGSDSNGTSGYSINVNGATIFSSANRPNFGASSTHVFAVTIPALSIFSCLSSDPNKDDDGDGILNYLDADYAAVNGSALNANGVVAILDTDGDGIINSLDLDSDNDGIFDIIEAGGVDVVGVDDVDDNGKIDGADATNVGANGVFDTIETTIDSGLLTYTIGDSDGDGIYDFKELDSDVDGCNDVIEAGYTDGNGDGLLADLPIIVDANGLVSGTNVVDGYNTPADGNSNNVYDFQEAGTSPSISAQTTSQPICQGANGSFSVVASGTDLIYQWQISTNGGSTFTNLSDVGVYTGTNNATLNITGALESMNGYQYQVIVGSSAYICSLTTSSPVTLTVPDVSYTASGVDPTTCFGADGSITLTGLVAGTNYRVSYSDDGGPQTPTVLTADASGDILINGLIAGSYTNIVATLFGCSGAPLSVTLSDPIAPVAPTSGGNQLECATIPTQTLTATATAPSGSSVVWYDAATGGKVVVSPTLNTVGTITYYAGSTDDITTCESTVRTAVTLTLQDCEADLTLKKGVNNSTPDVGDAINFRITLINNGPSDANSIIIRDIIPGDFTYTHPNFATSEGTVAFDSGTGALTWDLGAYVLTSGSSLTLTYTVTVDVCGEFVNKVEIIQSSQVDPDSTPNNGQ